MKRFLLIIGLGLILAIATSASPQTPVRCGNCGGSGGVLIGYNYYGPIYGPCGACGGTGVVWVYSTTTPAPTPTPNPNPNSNIIFRSDKSDGYISIGQITLTRASGVTDKFDGYKKGSGKYVKLGTNNYKLVNGNTKFVKINNVDYYTID